MNSKNTWRLMVILIVTLIVITPLSAQRRERVVDTWRPLHYDVTIEFNDQLSQIAHARTEIRGLILKDNVEAIDLDFGSMEIDSVTIADHPAYFEWTPHELLTVSLARITHTGDKFSIVINYHGRPKDGLILANDRDGKPSATGDNWPNRVHQWIPSLDHPSAKATVSFTVAAPPRDVVVANGKLMTMTRNGATSVWRFEETKPIPPYCMVVVVNQGAKLDAKEQLNTPLSYYVPERDRSYAPKGFSPAAPAVSFFSETIAPYPYEKLALIVGATRFGGMENSSAIVFASTLFDLRGNEKMSKRFGIPERIENVVAHEIAHQWFGDSVTESTWADLWLSEGFATYFAGLFIERHDGEDAFRDYMRTEAERYFVYEKHHSAPIHDTETQDLMKLLNANNYQKGAWVLHMLRKRLGDEAFFRGLRLYYHAHLDANATSEDLRDALEKVSGQDLKEFFARWVYGSGHPVYQFSWEWNGKTKTVKLSLKQLQMGPAFLDALPVEIKMANGRRAIVLKPEGMETQRDIKLDTAPLAVSLDLVDILSESVRKSQD
jgi:aminopeptidase N